MKKNQILITAATKGSNASSNPFYSFCRYFAALYNRFYLNSPCQTDDRTHWQTDSRLLLCILLSNEDIYPHWLDSKAFRTSPDLRTNRQTNQRTVASSYRDAKTHQEDPAVNQTNRQMGNHTDRPILLKPLRTKYSTMIARFRTLWGKRYRPTDQTKDRPTDRTTDRLMQRSDARRDLASYCVGA